MILIKNIEKPSKEIIEIDVHILYLINREIKIKLYEYALHSATMIA